MAQISKLELETEIKTSGDKLFDVYKNQSSLLPNICPEIIQSIEVVEGDGKSVGSVRLWTYVLGSPVIAKDRIDAVDEKNKSITFKLIGGEVTKYFKSFKATLQVTSQPKKNFIKWTLEYEKVNEEVPTPHSHLDFLVSASRKVDAYLLTA